MRNDRSKTKMYQWLVFKMLVKLVKGDTLDINILLIGHELGILGRGRQSLQNDGGKELKGWLWVIDGCMEHEKEEAVKIEIKRTKLAFVRLLGNTQKSGR
jgi:hypothetical protein